MPRPTVLMVALLSYKFKLLCEWRIRNSYNLKAFGAQWNMCNVCTHVITGSVQEVTPRMFQFWLLCTGRSNHTDKKKLEHFFPPPPPLPSPTHTLMSTAFSCIAPCCSLVPTQRYKVLIYLPLLENH